jgi:GntR family transcriptional regulator, gluconate operon transcriptional repressor
MARPRAARVDAAVNLRRVGPAHEGLGQGIADDLRDAILDGSIPAGASLVEADLAGRFGVSRGPVRDALRDLARQGLVIELPRRGTVVSTISLRDIQEVYEVREGLEIVAVRLAAVRATDADLAPLDERLRELEAAWDRGADYRVSLALDIGLHRAIVAIPGNRRLAESYERMLVQTQLNAITAAEQNPGLRRGMRKNVHRDILRGLRARDADRAVAAVIAHYVYARERLIGV